MYISEIHADDNRSVSNILTDKNVEILSPTRYENLMEVTIVCADHSGRAVYGMKCLRPLEHWHRGFESHSRHGCLRLFCVCV
jgi:hypothetical protein